MTSLEHEKERELSISILRDRVKPGLMVYCILRHTSQSGMSRAVSLVIGNSYYEDIYRPDNVKIEDISWLAARAMERKINQKHGGIIIGGCGMDMGFALVYELSHLLYPDGFECTGKYCPSNDHYNRDADYTPHMHQDGGYALRMKWL